MLWQCIHDACHSSSSPKESWSCGQHVPWCSCIHAAQAAIAGAMIPALMAKTSQAQPHQRPKETSATPL
eukprot:4256150-Amphidinium_carterae.1